MLDKIMPTSHILDLVFEPEKTMKGKVKAPCGPVAYLNRIMLKKKFKRTVNARNTRERTFTAKNINTSQT